MGSKANSEIALGDVRATSYNAATANAVGYVGTIEDAIAQIQAEPDEERPYWPLRISRERYELLGFLGVLRSAGEMSGLRGWSAGIPTVWTGNGFRTLFRTPEDDAVEYGAPDQPDEPGFYTLAYAIKHWPHCFKASGEAK